MYCPVCGLGNTEGARFCGACGTQLGAPPFPGTAPAAADRVLASMGDRFLALAMDMVPFAAVFAIVGMAVARRLGGITEQGFSFEGRPALLTIGLTMLLSLLYFWLCEGLCGATLGKGIIGIRVRRKDGSACGVGPSLIRNLLRLIDGVAVYLVGLIVALLSKQRQRIGDHLAGTVVVESRPGAAARSALVLLWLLILGGGFGGAYLLHRGAAVTEAVGDGGRTTEEASPAAPDAGGLASMNYTSTGNLRVMNFAYLQSEGGPSRPAGPYAPGDKVYLKYDIVDYSTDSEGRPRLQFDITAYDPNGLIMHTPWKDEFTGRLDSGSPVHGTFNLGIHRSAPGGIGKIIIKVRDLLSDSSLQMTVPFKVNAAPITPATTLEIRDFELSATEGGAATQSLELQDGGTVYMRCNVFGQQFRGDQADVGMAIRLIGPTGKVVFEKPDYGSIRDTYAYHPPTFYVPVTGHLRLPGGAAKGVYRVIYTFTDAISGNSVVKEGRFEVK